MAASDRFLRNLIEHSLDKDELPVYKDDEYLCRADNIPINYRNVGGDHKGNHSEKRTYRPFTYQKPRYFNIFAETKRLHPQLRGNDEEDQLYTNPTSDNIHFALLDDPFPRHVAWSQWGWPMSGKDSEDSGAYTWQQLNKPVNGGDGVWDLHKDKTLQERFNDDYPPHVPMFHQFAQDHLLRLTPCPLPDSQHLMKIPLTNPYQYSNTLLPEHRMVKMEWLIRFATPSPYNIMRDELNHRFNSVNVQRTMSDGHDAHLPTTDMRTGVRGEGTEEQGVRGEGTAESSFVIRPHDRLRRPLDLGDDVVDNVDCPSMHHRKDLDDWRQSLRAVSQLRRRLVIVGETDIMGNSTEWADKRGKPLPVDVEAAEKETKAVRRFCRQPPMNDGKS